MADDREVEPDIRVDCDLLILDYIVHDALGTLLAQAEDWLRDANNRKHHDALENIANKLRMVDSFLSTFTLQNPGITPSQNTIFLLHLLQFLALLILRHEQTAISVSAASLKTLRHSNALRAERWRSAAGKQTYSERLLDTYNTPTPSATVPHSRQDQTSKESTTRWRSWSPQKNKILLDAAEDGKSWKEIAGLHFPDKTADAVRRQHTTLGKRPRPASVDEDGDVGMFCESNGHDHRHAGMHTDGDGVLNGRTTWLDGTIEVPDEQQPTSVTLLDLLPSFMNITAMRMSMATQDDHDDASTSSESSSSADGESPWAIEPQWLHLAASFMLQAVLEHHLDLNTTGTSAILEAFSWGYIAPSLNDNHDNPTINGKLCTTSADSPLVDPIKSITIPDSDEGDITQLQLSLPTDNTTSTPTSSAVPSSHPSLFILRTEHATTSDSTASDKGKAWHTLRSQALQLLLPSPSPAPVPNPSSSSNKQAQDTQAHLTALRTHHPTHKFLSQLLEFCSHLFHSIEKPLLKQLEDVYPAWSAGRGAGGMSQTQPTQTQPKTNGGMGVGEDVDDEGEREWLEMAGKQVVVDGMVLEREEVERLMELVRGWWN